MTPLEVLIGGRELLDDPKHWTQRTLARDKNGQPTSSPCDANAVCFCTIGAIHKVVGRGELDLKYEVKKYLDRASGLSRSAMSFNDNRTHAEVLEMWDRAIGFAQTDARHQ